MVKIKFLFCSKHIFHAVHDRFGNFENIYIFTDRFEFDGYARKHQTWTNYGERKLLGLVVASRRRVSEHKRVGVVATTVPVATVPPVYLVSR